MSPITRTIRRLGSPVKQWLLPEPSVRAWRHACRAAERQPRYQSGTIHLLDYELEYADLLSTCPQWYDLFVQHSLRFESSKPRPYIVDCGSNIGLSVLAHKRDHAHARIVAFEADPSICAMLERNLAANGVGDVVVHNAAVWTDNGSVAFRCEGADSGAVDSIAATLEGETREVAAVRLRDVLVREPIDLLKLDIEGAECDVLQDCADALQNVAAMVIDLHEFDPSRRASPAVLSLLADVGFTYHQDALHGLRWREPVASAESPFPGSHLSWVSIIRAWRA